MIVNEPVPDKFEDTPAKDRDPDWFKRAVFYEVLVRSFQDSNGDGIGDLKGITAKLDYLQWLGVDCLWLPPFFKSPLRDGGYDVSDYTAVLPEFGDLADFVEFVDAAHQRGMRVIIDFVMNHTSDQHPWFQESRTDPRRAVRRLLRLGRRRQAVPRRPDHLRRHRSLQLDLRPGPQAVLLAPLLLPPAGPQLREPGRPGGDHLRPAVLARPGHRRLPARRGALPLRRGGHQLREPARHARLPQAGPRRDRRPLPGHRAARRGQPMARGRRRLLRRLRRRRRRMPHGVPLPRHAAHLHGGTPRIALPGLRNPRQDPGDPLRLPVGHLPAQPRRAHPRNGHRRRTRLHVRGIRQGPAHARQHRHPPAAGHRCWTTTATRSNSSPPCCCPCPARRSSTTATRSAWATTSGSATATRCAPRCSGPRTATPASPPATPAGSSCRRSWTRSTATRSPTSRPRCARPPRCCTGPAG